jgi:hypothetical protein
MTNATSKLQRVQIIDRQHPHFEEYGRFTGKIVTMKFGTRGAMSDCEWNPAENRPAFEGDPSHGEAVMMVGVDGKWHLCASCASSETFKRYRVRRPLTRRRPARVQRRRNRELAIHDVAERSAVDGGKDKPSTAAPPSKPSRSND